MTVKKTIHSLNTSSENEYIKASFKYVIIEEDKENDITFIKNSKIPGFSYSQKDINKELSFSEYKDYLYKWIEEKRNSTDPGCMFIPIVDRINLNETRVIDAYDPTKKQNAEQPEETLLKGEDMYSINLVKSKSLNTIPKKEK